MKKGVIFSIGLVLIALGFISAFFLILMSKEGQFMQKAIGDYSYTLIDKFYDAEMARQSLMQAGRFALTAALSTSLESGIKQDCQKENGIAIWNDCFPSKEDLRNALQSKVLESFLKYKNTNIFLNDNYEYSVEVFPTQIILTARPYLLVTYSTEKPSEIQQGAPYITPASGEIPQSSCQPPQRALSQKYLAAFAHYQTYIYAAAKRFSVEPALLAAIMTAETSFGTNPNADRADEYGKPLKDNIPDYVAGCRVCYIEGCLGHSTASDPAKSNWRAPPNKPEHNIMCAAERISTYKAKAAHGEAFGCLMDPVYVQSTEDATIKKLACTYNSGAQKYAYAEEVYSFYLQWKDLLCRQSPLTMAAVAAPQQRKTTHSAMLAFSAVIPFNMAEIESAVTKARELAPLCKQNPLICIQKSPFLDALCKEKYKILPEIEQTKSITFCVPVSSSPLHGKSYNLEFVLQATPLTKQTPPK